MQTNIGDGKNGMGITMDVDDRLEQAIIGFFVGPDGEIRQNRGSIKRITSHVRRSFNHQTTERKVIQRVSFLESKEILQVHTVVKRQTIWRLSDKYLTNMVENEVIEG